MFVWGVEGEHRRDAWISEKVICTQGHPRWLVGAASQSLASEARTGAAHGFFPGLDIGIKAVLTPDITFPCFTSLRISLG